MPSNNSVTDIAGMLSAVTGVVNYNSSGAVELSGTIPPNSQIIDINIDVTTAFNAGTTNTVTVGKSGAAAAFVAATSVGTTGRASVATTGVYSAWADTGAAEFSPTVTFSQTGTAATAGSARVTVVYKSFA